MYIPPKQTPQKPEHRKSVLMEESSYCFGVITGYRELTPEEKRRAKEKSLRLQKKFGFVKTEE